MKEVLDVDIVSLLLLPHSPPDKTMFTMMILMMMMNLAGEGEPVSFSVEEERTRGEVEAAC